MIVLCHCYNNLLLPKIEALDPSERTLLASPFSEVNVVFSRGLSRVVNLELKNKNKKYTQIETHRYLSLDSSWP